MQDEFAQKRSCWDRAHAEYTCADGTKVLCRFETVQISWVPAPKNGVQPHRGRLRALVVGGAQMDRGMTAINMASQAKTYALPRTVTTVVAFAFQNKRQLQSVVLNEGLERVEPRCFEGSQVRRLVLPSSVTDVGFSAFANCESLRSADLSTARGLKKLGDRVFGYCAELK